MPKKSVGKSLVETIKDSDLSDVAGELTEVGIDAFLDEGVLKNIPVINVIHGLWKTGVAVRDYIFIQKLLMFLDELAEIPREERVQMIEQLEQDSTYRENVGENILLILEQLDHLEKAKYAGRAFSAYCKGYIDSETLERLLVAIDRIVLRDIPHLQLFIKKPGSLDKAITQSFLNAGLGYVPFVLGANTDVANISLCRAFIRYILKKEIKDDK